MVEPEEGEPEIAGLTLQEQPFKKLAMRCTSSFQKEDSVVLARIHVHRGMGQLQSCYQLISTCRVTVSLYTTMARHS
jgi:hypothetical protein